MVYSSGFDNFVVVFEGVFVVCYHGDVVGILNV